MSLERLAGFGLHVLRLQPGEIWQCAFREFLNYAGFLAAAPNDPSRGVLNSLMRRFPDQIEQRKANHAR